MKIRHGFVSNSSTSSFTCDICDEEYTGWDACPSEFNCSTCENEHVMCNDHLTEIVPLKEKGCDHEFDRVQCNFCPECGEKAWVDEELEYGDISAKQCPICKFQGYSNSEMAKYLEITRKMSRAVVFEEIKKINKRRRKLYDNEYISTVCREFNLTDDLLLAEIKQKFEIYDNYRKFLDEKQ
ncbi:MAG: hypothetical protein WC375_03995 [Methanomassiliicoccales archaeon]|jgi:hypothetical protein